MTAVDEAAVMEAYRHVADGYARVLAVRGPAEKLDSLRACYRAAPELAARPFVWSTGSACGPTAVV